MRTIVTIEDIDKRNIDTQSDIKILAEVMKEGFKNTDSLFIPNNTIYFKYYIKDKTLNRP